MEADVLSQEEVDALLTGVEDEPASATETGPAVAEPPSAPPPEVAEPAIPPLAPGEEVDPLLAAFPELFAPPAEEAPVAPGELSIDPWLLGFSEIVEAETRAHAAAVAASSTPAAPAPAPGQAARGPRHGREELTVTATLTRSDLARASQTEALKMPGLERVAENLVPLLARAMRRLLRRDVTVSGEPIVFTNWEQALADAGRAKLLRLGMAPLPGQAAVAFSDELVDILVEHLFGSNGRLYRAPGEAPRPPGHQRRPPRRMCRRSFFRRICGS